MLSGTLHLPELVLRVCRWSQFASHPLTFLPGYANETATFIAECAEDDNDEVAKAARTLRRSVEAVAGSLSGILI